MPSRLGGTADVLSAVSDVEQRIQKKLLELACFSAKAGELDRNRAAAPCVVGAPQAIAPPARLAGGKRVFPQAESGTGGEGPAAGGYPASGVAAARATSEDSLSANVLNVLSAAKRRNARASSAVARVGSSSASKAEATDATVKNRLEQIEKQIGNRVLKLQLSTDAAR